MKLPERFTLEHAGWRIQGERLRPVHVPAVRALEEACFASPWSEALLMQEAQARDHSWNLVMEVDGDLHAFFFNWVILDEMHLLNFAVHPSRQGRGLGGVLLDWMLAQAVESRFQVVHLEVRASNRPAIALYESRGFSTLFRRQAYYTDNGEDALVMLRTLETDPAGKACD